jgi:SAM-dependent methyltransferase
MTQATTFEATYRNYQHYLEEGWRKEPRRYFHRAGDLLAAGGLSAGQHLLDLGCATGNFLGYLHQRFPGTHLTGVDVYEELVVQARQLAPYATFLHGSVLDLPTSLSGCFDTVTALGVLSIFYDHQLGRFLDNVLGCLRPGGRALIFSPFNEYGVDVMTRHRKRIDGRLRDWEVSWNTFSFETIGEALAGRCRGHRFHPFRLGLALDRPNDPGRTWTMKTEANEHQLVNGLKLLIDPYFLEIEV